MTKKLSDFEHGIFYAAGVLIEDDQPSFATDILAAAGLLESKESGDGENSVNTWWECSICGHTKDNF